MKSSNNMSNYLHIPARSNQRAQDNRYRPIWESRRTSQPDSRRRGILGRVLLRLLPLLLLRVRLPLLLLPLQLLVLGRLLLLLLLLLLLRRRYRRRLLTPPASTLPSTPLGSTLPLTLASPQPGTPIGALTSIRVWHHSSVQ